MIMTAEMIADIKRIVEEMNLNWNYEFVGVRVQEVPFELGAIDHKSHVWIDGEETDEELDGICTCKVDRLKCKSYEGYYVGDHAAIICGNEGEYGEDDGEIIIRDAEVVKILC